MRHVVTAMVMVLVTTSMVPAAAAGPSGGADAGAHVAFDVSGDAVTNYRVDGEPMLASIEMRAADDTSGGVGVDADVSTAVDVDGAALSIGSETETSTTVSVEGGGSMTAHDNANGVLLFSAGDGAQYVQASPGDGATAEERSDGTVAVTSANGTTGTFLVVGQGNVSVDETGNVTAKVGQDGRLVFRSYPDGRDEGERERERLISNGTAVGEVSVVQQGGETATDVVTYGQNTSVTAKQTAEHGVEVTVDRAQHEGKVIITSLSDAAEESGASSDDTTEADEGGSKTPNAENLRVTVDGEAAAQASSYGELRGAIGGDRSKYLVEQRSSATAEASADVLVAVNHFSTRTIRIGSADGTTDGGDTTADDDASSEDGTTSADAATGGSGDANDESTVDDGAVSNDSGQPGFGVGAALAALLSVAFVAIRRR